jgi:GxxExxY protein
MNADGTPMNADSSRARLDLVSRRVIGSALKVSSTLGVGFLEKVYENALIVELHAGGLQAEQQRPVHVSYGGTIVGDYIPDILVEREMVVEIKAVPTLEPNHRQQCINYLRATNLKVCLLLNFGRPRMEVRRIVWNY